MNKVTVDFEKLLDAFEWTSAGEQGENAAYVSRETGKIYWVDAQGEAVIEELQAELPADLDDAALYVPLPHKNDLNLGRRLVFAFVDAQLPDAYDRTSQYFSKRGAYSRFKQMLEEMGQLDAWYAYENAAVERALREWANDNQILITQAGGATATVKGDQSPNST